MSKEIVEPKQESLPMLSPEVVELLAQAAQTKADAEMVTTAVISLKNKRFTLNDIKLGTSLDVVILADAYEHAYYDKPYDPDVISPPACFAINTVHADMKPEPDKWFIPLPQAEKCQGCPLDEFGTARQGKGKACRNGRRLLVAAVSNGKANLKDLAVINVPPTSLKAFSRYVKQITTSKKLPLWAVVTNFEFDDDSTYPVLIPSCVGGVSGEDINHIAQSLMEYEKQILTPYDCTTWVPPASVEEVAASTAKKSKMS